MSLPVSLSSSSSWLDHHEASVGAHRGAQRDAPRRRRRGADQGQEGQDGATPQRHLPPTPRTGRRSTPPPPRRRRRRWRRRQRAAGAGLVLGGHGDVPPARAQVRRVPVAGGLAALLPPLAVRRGGGRRGLQSCSNGNKNGRLFVPSCLLRGRKKGFSRVKRSFQVSYRAVTRLDWLMLDYDAPREEVDPWHRPPPVPNNNGLPVFPPSFQPRSRNTDKI